MKKALEIIALSAALLLPFGQRAMAEKSETDKPKIEIILNYDTETELKKIDYQTSKVVFTETDSLWRESNIPEITPEEKTEITNIMIDIKNEDISYNEIVETIGNFSENQKIVFLSAFGNFLYNIDYKNLKCLGISSRLERIANESGTRTAVVLAFYKRRGHAYVILKNENKTAIVDSYNILVADTKNIEKTLEAYQKQIGTTMFEHLFFENEKFKYRLVTEDGKNFLNFIEYADSSKSIKDALIYQNTVPKTDLTVNLTLEDYLTSVALNYKGIFMKVGEIKGSLPSPMNKTNLFQAGFERDFNIKNINIKPNINLVYGQIFQDTEVDSNKIFGIIGKIIANTKNEKGFNLSLRSALDIFPKNPPLGNTFSYDSSVGAGVSYRIPIKNISIEPYTITQLTFFPKIKKETYVYIPKPAELISGAVFEIKKSDANFSIEPYYVKRIWEQGFGGNIKFDRKNFGIDAGGNVTWSNYEFCPDKYNFEIGSHLNLKNLTVGINYKIEGTNYDGEKEAQSSLKLSGSMKF